MNYMEETISTLKQFEGCVPWMYLDTVGLVTVGVGNMLPNAEAACAMPFRATDGLFATAEQVSAEYARVKAMQKGMLAWTYKTHNSPTLSENAIDTIMTADLVSFENGLRALLPAYDSFPDAGKVAMLHMIYNLGARGLPDKFPKLCAAVRAGEWHIAAMECQRPQLSAARNLWTVEEFEKAALANVAV